MHFDRKGWRIRKKACENFGLSVQWPLVLWLHGFVNNIVYKVSFFFFFFYKIYLCSASAIMSVHTMTILHLNKSCYTHTVTTVVLQLLVLLTLALQSIVLSCILGKPP